MKIQKVTIKNFRAYKEEARISFDDLNVFIGKNDVGKSSILEALDIFFNDKDANVKIEKEDLNKKAEGEGDDEIMISIAFSNFPTEIDLDAGNKTVIQNEYLLNSEEFLEIKKIYKNGKCSDIFIKANHPTCDLGKELLLKKQADLKKIVESNSFECSNKTKNAELRKSIWDNCEDLQLQEIDIPIKKEDAKTVWDNLQRYLPIYALFQSDRSNNDQDREVQDPMKLAVKEIIQDPELQNKFIEIAKEVELKTTEIADSTLEKLKEMNPEIAAQLKPNIPKAEDLKWADVFKNISISSDDNIPLNKRGSGVKRLVLLNFFRAEADRRKKERRVGNVIYAIEEPETSQHPNHQKLLINAFIELSKTGNTQIILTTHSPAIAQLLPVQNLKFVRQNSGILKIESGENILLDIAETLGVLPNLSKVVICVEGENDRKFLMNINQNIQELKTIVDLKSRQISIIPMAGSNLKNWIQRNYLANSNVIEFHLYDRDKSATYQSAIDQVNGRRDLSCGKLTQKRELENYFHKSLIEGCEEFEGVQCSSINDWDNSDIPNFIASKCEKNEEPIKCILNGKVAKKMTKNLLEDVNAWDEVEGWFKDVKRLFESTIRT